MGHLFPKAKVFPTIQCLVSLAIGGYWPLAQGSCLLVYKVPLSLSLKRGAASRSDHPFGSTVHPSRLPLTYSIIAHMGRIIGPKEGTRLPRVTRLSLQPQRHVMVTTISMDTMYTTALWFLSGPNKLEKVIPGSVCSTRSHLVTPQLLLSGPVD
jgi:hypothetical protein